MPLASHGRVPVLLMRRHPYTLLFCCLMLGALIGCGLVGADVRGRVLFREEPLPDAKVVFSAPGRPMCVATTDQNGMYRLVVAGRPGIPPGSYAVAISAYETRDGRPGDPPIPVFKTPARYNQAQTSGLVADLKAGANTVDFNLR